MAMKILIFGASGLVGGALLSQLAQEFPDATFTVWMRTNLLDSAIESLGRNVTIVYGDLSIDLTQLRELAAVHDVVINAATSRDPEPTKAILRGATEHQKKRGQNTILLHLSGAGNFSDNSTAGRFIEPKTPFDDTNPEQVERINSTLQPNGAADEMILRDAAKGLVNAYIVCPGGIYGASKQHIAHKADTSEGRKYASVYGVWAKWMFDSITDRGFSLYIGPGTSVFPTIHVDDVVDLTMTVFHLAITTGQAYQPSDVFGHYYLAIAETIQAKELATIFANASHRLGLIPKVDVRSSTDADRENGHGNLDEATAAANRYLAGNIIVQAGNAAKLGWKPAGPSLKEILEAM